MKKKKILWIAIAVVAVIVIASAIFKGGKEITEVSTEKVSKRTITELVSVTGKIQPEQEVKISPDVSGEITEMLVQEGDSVVKGQLLLRINPEIYESTLSQLKANLDNSRAALAGAEAQELRAKTALETSKITFDRQKKLFESQVISAQEWENAQLQFEQAKTEAVVSSKNKLASSFNVRSLEARLDEGRKTLGRTSIYAPASGIVTQMNSEKGERVVGTAQMAGTEIMRISNLSSMEVQVNINENDIVRVHLGDSADIRVDAYPDRVFKGVVSEIANSAKFNTAQNVSEQVTNYTVKIRISRASYADLISKGIKSPLLPGMTASADIKTNTRSQVVSVPISALTTRNPQSFKNGSSPVTDSKTSTWVFKYENGKAKAVKIEVGIQDIDYFEVLSGLKDGEEIIVEPSMAIAKTLVDGDKVKISK
ncbi:MAG: efflux RND transporter periplasmic adaptor subunit [Bacteroidia bacterium]|nr:efflux RND transporter periplasmic adaptor subunit [Bacteroidia bacterium]